MKRFIALLMAAIMVLSMAACQNNDTTTTTPDPAPAPSDTTPPADPQQTQDNAETIIESKEYLKTYKTSFSSSYASFNYFSTAYSTVRGIVANCIDGLVEPNIYGVYVPSIAESWEVNDDQTVWTFKIREGVNCAPMK
jgi:ABC-type transport system substrate-binding protein